MNTMTDLIYSKTSKQLLELLGHYTTVTLKNQKSIKGYLYTIDPQSRNAVLFDIKDQRVLVIMNSSIQDLNSKKLFAYSSSFIYLFIYLYFFTLVDNEDHIDLQIIDDALKYQNENQFTNEWLDKRRNDLIQHLEKVFSI